MDTEISRNPTAGAGAVWNLLLGVWLIISPFVLAFTILESAKWNNIAVGAAVGLMAIGRLNGRQSTGGWGWLNVLLGIWLIISPWVLGFSRWPTPLWNNVILGIIVAVVAWVGASGIPVRDVPQPPAP